jgi:hypothetical protein
MAEEATINYYTHSNPIGSGATNVTRHSTPEFPYNYVDCFHDSRPKSLFSAYEFGTNAPRMKSLFASMHEPITSKSPTTARLRVFLRPPHKMQQGESAPELHAIIKISKRIDIHEWEIFVKTRLVDGLLQRGDQEGLSSHVVTTLYLDVPIVSDVSKNTKPITDFFKKTKK